MNVSGLVLSAQAVDQAPAFWAMVAWQALKTALLTGLLLWHVWINIIGLTTHQYIAEFKHLNLLKEQVRNKELTKQ